MKNTVISLSLLLFVLITISGCTENVTKTETGGTAIRADDNALTKEESAWWCVEHGIPESMCSMCDSKVAADMKKKGDWCAEHDRAETQCFKCNPALESKFADQFEAKFGRRPPKVSE